MACFNSPRGRGTQRALSVALNRASAKGSSTSQPTSIPPAAVSHEATPSPEGLLASAVSPVANIFQCVQEDFPMNYNLKQIVAPPSVKEVHLPTVHSKETGKGQGSVLIRNTFTRLHIYTVTLIHVCSSTK